MNAEQKNAGFRPYLNREYASEAGEARLKPLHSKTYNTQVIGLKYHKRDQFNDLAQRRQIALATQPTSQRTGAAAC
jgi:hypothetical protein